MNISEILKEYVVHGIADRNEITQGLWLRDRLTKLLENIKLEKRDAYNPLPNPDYSWGKNDGYNHAVQEQHENIKSALE